jgi:RNA polymerase sigma-70 factor (ECF subfamily)
MKNGNVMDEELLDAIYRQYYKNIYNYICFRINNHHDSEELASSVFENAIRKFHTFKPELSPVEAWLIGIAKNVVTDYLRRKKRGFFVPIDNIYHLVSFNRQPEEALVMNEENKLLIQAMSRLKDAERQILSMKFASDLGNCEIARILGISESNAGVIIHRTIQKLRKIMNRDGNGNEK